MKKSKIKDIAAQCLAANPSLEAIHMTSDGQGYSRLELAESRQHTIDASKKVISVNRVEKAAAPVQPEGDKTDSLVDLSVPKLTEALKDVSDVEQLTVLLAEETDKGEAARSTAIKAIEDRLEELASQDED